jgi:V8-like Glu-specific endopeptidase
MKVRMNSHRALVRLVVVVAFASPLAPSRALVGAAPDGRFADRVAMVLMRGGSEAGFCTALVLDSRTLLTAAHCLRRTRDMAVHYRDASGAPVVVPVEAAIVHPLYRPNAVRERVLSIDVGLIRTASPLDPRFADAALASGAGPSVGERVILSGYGADRDDDWKSGGELRSVTLAVREPASNVLIWAADPEGRVAGACSGDSGAPIWSADGAAAVAIATWAQAPHGRGCGGLTQGPRLAPLRNWIEKTRQWLARGGPAPQ